MDGRHITAVKYGCCCTMAAITSNHYDVIKVQQQVTAPHRKDKEEKC